MSRRIAYIVNQYPKVSHSFIRREILALNRLGLTIQRYALRGWGAELVDADDLQEQTRTRFVLQDGVTPVAIGLLSLALRKPREVRTRPAVVTALSMKNLTWILPL